MAAGARELTTLPAARQAAASERVPWFEQLFIVIALLMFSSGIIPVLREQQGIEFDPSQGDAALRTTFIAIHVVALLFILYRLHGFLRAMLRDKLILALALLPLVSTVWSTEPEMTLRRAIALTLTTAFGFYVASRFTLPALLSLLAKVMLIALLLSIVFALLRPELGIMQGFHQGAWRGIYLHKNALGRMMDLAVLVFALLALSDRRRATLYAPLTLLAIVVIVLTQSAGALVVAAFILSLLPFARILQRSRSMAAPLLIILLMVGATFAIVAYADFTTVLGALGKDETLTGRTQLWSIVIEQIRERPFLGYGYDGFWLGWNGPSAIVWLAFPWLPPHAHNGILDLWLDLGIIGVLLFAASVAYGYRNAIAWARGGFEWERLWPFVFISFLMLANAAESVVLQSNDLLWVLYVATLSSIAARQPATEPDAPAAVTTRPGAGVSGERPPAAHHLS